MAKKQFTFHVPVQFKYVMNMDVVGENVYFAMGDAHNKVAHIFKEKLEKGELTIDDFDIEALGQTMPGFDPDIEYEPLPFEND